MHRLFVAIRPPEHIRDLLVDAMDDSPELRWVPYENLHLTLRFIGEVERPMAEDLGTTLERVTNPAFVLSIAGVGSFDRRGGGALWAAVTPKVSVAALAAKVERACLSAGVGPEHRAFHPHITLARYDRRGAAKARDFIDHKRGLSSASFTVDRFVLFESRLSRHGSHYEETASYPLL